MRFASCEMQGWRTSMEDASLCIPHFAEGVSLFGVFDGHGGTLRPKLLGSEIALYAKQNLPKILLNSAYFKAKDYKKALVESFTEIDKQLLRELDMEIAVKGKARRCEAGSTACVALITDSEIYVANCGDSRCVMSRSGNAIQMSVDHRISSSAEQRRILKAGGTIESGRINGRLGIPRSLGDLQFKDNKVLQAHEQMVICLPDVKVEVLTPGTEFVVIACDGVWDCLGCQEVVNYIAANPKGKLSEVVGDMFDKILPEVIDENCTRGRNE